MLGAIAGRLSSRRLGNLPATSSTRARTSGSASPVQATPTSTSPGETSGTGSRSGARALIIRMHSSTLRAIGPTWSNDGASGKQPAVGTNPNVGLNPTTPQHAAGARIDPAVSEPSAASATPAASAAAEPPLDPPAIRPAAIGLGTVP